MAIPDPDSLRDAILRLSADGEEYSRVELTAPLAEEFGITHEELTQMAPYESKYQFTQRFIGVLHKLAAAGLVERTGGGYFRITPIGLAAVAYRGEKPTGRSQGQIPAPAVDSDENTKVTGETLDGRDNSREFAGASMKNLDFITDAAQNSADVNPVTQIVGALLVIIVFPWERNALKAVRNKTLPIAAKEGWPAFAMSGPRARRYDIKTVGDLIEQLRRAVAQGHVRFDPDSRTPREVTVTFENCPVQGRRPEWRGEIRADDLREFCRMFSRCIADHVA